MPPGRFGGGTGPLPKSCLFEAVQRKDTLEPLPSAEYPAIAPPSADMPDELLNRSPGNGSIRVKDGVCADALATASTRVKLGTTLRMVFTRTSPRLPRFFRKPIFESFSYQTSGFGGRRRAAGLWDAGEWGAFGAAAEDGEAVG